MKAFVTQLGVIAALIVCVVPAVAAGQNPSQPLPMQIVEFSWPLATGTVVPSGATAVTFDRGMGFQMRFRLPAECAALDDAVGMYGAEATAGLRSVYDSAREFCARARVFSLGAATASRDFVSRVNLTTLPLDLVPFDAHCRPTAAPAWLDLCARVRAHDPAACASGSLPAEVSFARPVMKGSGSDGALRLDCRPARVDPVGCRLSKSHFTGVLTQRNGVVRCTPQAVDPANDGGLRLYDVTYRDVNRDGVMDAVLSVSDPGAGGEAPASWYSFALTKRSAAGALERLPLE